MTVRTDLATLMAGRRGHVRLESGHHGDLWLDLDGVFADPTLIRPLVDELAGRLPPASVVCGPLTGGGFLAQLLAGALGARFCFARRLADASRQAPAYRVPAGLRPLLSDAPVVIVDDVINAGSAVGATLRDVIACGGRPIAIGALLVLGHPTEGSRAADLAGEYGIPLASLDFEPTIRWGLDECPLCAAGEPLADYLD